MEMRMEARTMGIIGLVAIVLGTVALLPPIPQDPAYHIYADQRTVLGIPNFWNVVSNLPFVLLGLIGVTTIGMNRTPGYLPELKPIYTAFFAGVFLTGLGSTYYHLEPVNSTILWDRLALTILFMAFFSAVWGEHISPSAAVKMVWPLIAIGMASVVYWYITETRNPRRRRPASLRRGSVSTAVDAAADYALLPLPPDRRGLCLGHPGRLRPGQGR